MARGVRADRAGLGLRLGRDAHRPRGATATSTSSTAASASSRTRASPGSTSCSRRPTPTAGHSGISAFVVEADAPGLRGRADRAEDGHQGLDDRRDLLRRLPHPGRRTCSARRARASGSRCGSSTARGRGSRAQGLGIAQGATDYALEYAKHARDDGQADRAAPADRRRSSPTWRRSARRRAGCSTSSAQMVDEGVDGRGADEALGDGEALLHRRRRWRSRPRPCRSSAATATCRSTRSSA